MSGVVYLSDYRAAKQRCEEVDEETVQALTGTGICAACRHEWELKQKPIPAVHFECPSCYSERGVFKHPIEMPEGSLVAACIWCQGQIFQLTSMGTFCVGCAAYHSWDNHPAPA